MPTICYKCFSTSIQEHITSRSNRNGNAGRPFLKCQSCTKFLGFTDERGNCPDNPPCDCGEPSKTQLVGLGLGKRVPRGVFFVCRRAECNYYAELVNEEGDQVRATEVVEELLAGLRIF
ncbi:hypothetical protein B0T16DRAFT_171222 [Cercophora newfieldiana]|uniref:GRF-like zinc ribbon domain-containing protein n=1 Tax=Cercophora newfieldiana TaxID=92897 RepID=A0AA39Y6I5_9PEZI|nr:hypothetical protein B0T16DRAFT_171222 [Cercophora newfieldiana]